MKTKKKKRIVEKKSTQKKSSDIFDNNSTFCFTLTDGTQTLIRNPWKSTIQAYERNITVHWLGKAYFLRFVASHSERSRGKRAKMFFHSKGYFGLTTWPKILGFKVQKYVKNSFNKCWNIYFIKYISLVQIWRVEVI